MKRYVKLNCAHDGFDAALATCRTAFSAAHPGNVFSVTEEPDGTDCWVLTTTSADVTVGGAVLDIQDGGNSRARTDVTAWFPPPDMPV